MNRRNAVIRVLATIAAAMVGKSSAQEPSNIGDGTLTVANGEIVLSKHQTLSLGLVDAEDKDSWGITTISVNYGGRVVVLTAKEIMEALEG